MGGYLFEQWFCCFGKEKAWKDFIKTPETDFETRSFINLKEQIWNSNKLRWYGWILKGTKDISNKSTKQLFWTTLAAKAKGLSNSGQDVFDKLGFTLQNRIFTMQEDEHLALQQIYIRHQVENEPHV